MKKKTTPVSQTKEYHREYSRKWCEANREQRKETALAWYHRNKEKACRKAREKYKSNCAEELKAWAKLKVRNEVRYRGLKSPDNCSKCNKIGKIEGHHNDYSKPLELEWLCAVCHRRKHFMLEKKDLNKEENSNEDSSDNPEEQSS